MFCPALPNMTPPSPNTPTTSSSSTRQSIPQYNKRITSSPPSPPTAQQEPPPSPPTPPSCLNISLITWETASPYPGLVRLPPRYNPCISRYTTITYWKEPQQAPPPGDTRVGPWW